MGALLFETILVAIVAHVVKGRASDFDLVGPGNTALWRNFKVREKFRIAQFLEGRAQLDEFAQINGSHVWSIKLDEHGEAFNISDFRNAMDFFHRDPYLF